MATIASLIVDVAANTVALQRDVAQINTTLESVGGTASKLTGMLAGAFSVGAVVAYAKEIASYASDMEDAAAKTGIGVEQLQALNYAASGAGVSVDQIAGAVAQLSKRLIGGNDNAVDALETLGLRVSDIIAMDPAEAFLTISERIAGIENPMKQAAIAMDLFGKSGAELLPAMKENLRGLMEQARSTGAVLGEDLVKKAGAFDDAWDHGVITMKAWTAQLLDLGGRGMEVHNGLSDLLDVVSDLSAVMGNTGNMDAAIDRLERMSSGSRTFVRQVDDLKMSTYALEQAQKQLEDQERKNIKAREEHERATRKAEEAQRAYINWIGEREIQAYADAMEAERERVDRNKQAIDEVTRSLEAYTRYVEQAVEDEKQALKDSEAAWAQWQQDVAADMTAHEHDMIDSTERVGGAFRVLGEVADQIFGRGFRQSIKSMVDAFKSGEASLASIGMSILQNFTGVMGGIMAGIQMIKLAWSGLKALFSREVEHANDTRDQFILSNWPGGGAELAALLTSLGAGEGGGSLYNALIKAEDVAGVNAAKAAIERFMHEKGVPGFAMGSGGFQNFGGGTLAVLHGEERVQTKAQAVESDGAASELRALSMTVAALVRDLPNQIQAAMAIGRGRGMSRA